MKMNKKQARAAMCQMIDEVIRTVHGGLSNCEFNAPELLNYLTGRCRTDVDFKVKLRRLYQTYYGQPTNWGLTFHYDRVRNLLEALVKDDLATKREEHPAIGNAACKRYYFRIN